MNRPTATADPPVRGLHLERTLDRGRAAAVEELEGLHCRQPADHRCEGDLAGHVRAVREGELNGERVPRWVAIKPMQVGTAQATGQAWQDERADCAGIARESDEQVRAVSGVQRVAPLTVDRFVQGQHDKVGPLAERQRQAIDLRSLSVHGTARGFAEWHPLIGWQQATRNTVVEPHRRHVDDMDAPDAGSREDGR
jgi:hypothetical protein